MKFVTLSITAGGAAVAAFLTAATANAEDPATTPSWTPNYTIDDAQLLQGANPLETTWAVPASFTNGEVTLAGTSYLTPSLFGGGIDNQFITDDGAIYDQNQLGFGFTNLYYNPGGEDATVVDILKTPFGSFDISSMASIFAPADVADLIVASPLAALESAGLYSALNLGLDDDASDDLTWTPTYDTDGAQLLADDDPLSQTWMLDASFSNGDGDTLSGTNYVTQSLFGGGIDNQFVTDDGAVYDQNQLGFGFTNLYYNPGGDDATVVDILKTPFGSFDISSLASWFAPTDFSDVDAASPLTDLQDAGLYSVLDLGLDAGGDA